MNYVIYTQEYPRSKISTKLDFYLKKKDFIV